MWLLPACPHPHLRRMPLFSTCKRAVESLRILITSPGEYFSTEALVHLGSPWSTCPWHKSKMVAVLPIMGTVKTHFKSRISLLAIFGSFICVNNASWLYAPPTPLLRLKLPPPPFLLHVLSAFVINNPLGPGSAAFRNADWFCWLDLMQVTTDVLSSWVQLPYHVLKAASHTLYPSSSSCIFTSLSQDALWVWRMGLI